MKNQNMTEQKIWMLSSLLSSSSSDTDEEEYLPLLEARKSLPKIQNFVEDVINKFDEHQFQKYFRMRRETANKLIEKFKSSVYFPKNDGHGGRVPIPADTHVYSFLWFAGNKATIKDVAQRFNITESSFERIRERMFGFLLEIGPMAIKMPSTNAEKEKLSVGFQKISGFPGVLGCIDGTSIHIRTPAHKIKSTYVNRHDIPSITLQGICDFNRKFIDVFTGIPGKVHDARVFKLSDIWNHLPDICGTRYHILGDGAYSIRPWLLIPYRYYGNLTRDQAVYNKKFSATRVLIENTFGILKGRFRQLLKLEMLSVVNMTKFIIACCILHNFCIDCEDVLPQSEIYLEEEDNVETYDRENDFQLKKKGEEKRNHIKDSFHYM